MNDSIEIIDNTPTLTVDDSSPAITAQDETPTVEAVDNTPQVCATDDRPEITVTFPGLPGPPGPAAIWEDETYAIDAADVANGYLDLGFTPLAGALFLFLNGQYISSTCYTVTTNRITWTSTRPPRVGAQVDAKYQR